MQNHYHPCVNEAHLSMWSNKGPHNVDTVLRVRDPQYECLFHTFVCPVWVPHKAKPCFQKTQTASGFLKKRWLEGQPPPVSCFTLCPHHFVSCMKTSWECSRPCYLGSHPSALIIPCSIGLCRVPQVCSWSQTCPHWQTLMWLLSQWHILRTGRWLARVSWSCFCGSECLPSPSPPPPANLLCLKCSLSLSGRVPWYGCAAERHLGYFRPRTAMNNAATDSHVRASVWTHKLISVG